MSQAVAERQKVGTRDVLRWPLVKHPTVVDPEALIRELTNAGVEFIIVGGSAAVLHSAPVTTQDLDIIHSRRQSPRR